MKRDGNNILLNDGKNPTENGFTVIHHESWDKGVGFRDFEVPVEGEYVIRFRAAGRVPTREEVVASVTPLLEKRRDEQMAKNPKGKAYHDRDFENTLRAFRHASQLRLRAAAGEDHAESRRHAAR